MAPVEARSLASLVALASNPPQYPRNPTAERLDPLVLYIARVPGSKDVFLTTIKPRQKVVTAEDVSSCLYFLHFDQASEGESLLEVQYTRREREVQLEARPNQVLRKPLAERPLSSSVSANIKTSSFGENDIYRPTVSDSQHHATSIDRKPVQGTPRLELSQPSGGRPPPSPSEQSAGRGALKTLAHSSENIRPRNGHLQPQHPRSHFTFDTSRSPETASHRGLESTSTHAPLLALDTSRRGGQQHQQSRNSSSLDGQERNNSANSAMTLIRRDPGSGAQWNVAIISNESGTLETSEEVTTNLNPAPPTDTRSEIDLEIHTPGYSKFITQQITCNDTFPSEGLRKENLLQPQHPIAPNPRQTVKVFKRKLLTENTSFLDQSRQPSRPGSLDFSVGNVDLSSGRNWGRNNTQKNSPDQTINENDQSLGGRPVERRQGFVPRSRGFVFLSPWAGRCEFATGFGGRTLKCKHTLPGNSSGIPQSPPVTISELRFNLPGTTTQHVPSNRVRTPVTMTKEAKRSSLFRKHLSGDHGSNPSLGLNGRSNSSDDQESPQDPDALDLSLGQENAGGGFGGKKAKLGKLIVEEEGLKMLDLLVAANMGVWWKVYQRVQGGSA